MKLNIFVQIYMNKRNEVVQMMSVAIQVISYLNEIISLNQLRSNSYSRRKIRRLAICESFIYLKFPPNLFFKSRSHLSTVLVYNKNVNSLHTLSAISCIISLAGHKGPQSQAITLHSISFLKTYQLLHFSLSCRGALFIYSQYEVDTCNHNCVQSLDKIK